MIVHSFVSINQQTKTKTGKGVKTKTIEVHVTTGCGEQLVLTAPSENFTLAEIGLSGWAKDATCGPCRVRAGLESNNG